MITLLRDSLLLKCVKRMSNNKAIDRRGLKDWHINQQQWIYK